MPLYGILAEFENPEELLAAAKSTRAAGFTSIDAFTPFPIEGLSDNIGYTRTKLPMIVLGGGILGAITGYGMQYYAHVIHYPQIIGGRPFHSWPAFIPITFELTILFAAMSAVFGMLALNGLPTPYHPVFNVPQFEMASQSRFFLVVKSKDPKFDETKTRQFLEKLKPEPIGVYDVEK